MQIPFRLPKARQLGAQIDIGVQGFQTSSSSSNESWRSTNFAERSKRKGTSRFKSNSTWFQLRFPA